MGLDRKALSNQLIGLHLGLALATQIPQMELKKEEADALASALADLQEEYGVKINRKAQLWFALVTALGVVYVPRGKLLFARLDQIAREKKSAQLARS